MELRHLRYFLAVAETGSVSRAAEKLYVAQPPLSVQLRQLEQELGAVLFERHAKGMLLTKAGQALRPEAEAIVQRAGALRAGLLGVKAGAWLKLALGYVPSAAGTVLPALLPALRRRCPGLELSLHEAISREQAEAIASGALDAGIARAVPADKRIAVTCRVDDPFALATAPSTMPAGPADLRSFADAPFVGFTRHRGPAYFDQSIVLCGQAGFSPRIVAEASTLHGVLDLVRSGVGVALVPRSAMMLVAGLSIRPLRRPRSPGELLLLQRKGDRDALAGVLLAEVERAFAGLVARLARRLGT